MRRKLFTISAILSLPLFLATLVLCVISLVREQSFGWVCSIGSLKITASRGILVFKLGLLFGHEAYPGEFNGYYHRSQSPPTDLQIYGVHTIASHGFGYFYMAGMATSGHWVQRWLLLPGWLVTILFGCLPFAWGLSNRRERIRKHRMRAGLCITCGYSLIANTSGVCPECGTAVVTRKTEAVA